MRRLWIVILVLLAGCTENTRARTFGGTATKDLEPGRKLVNVTWKETDMWIVTRAWRPGDAVEQYLFEEDSSFGLIEGTVIIQEHAP